METLQQPRPLREIILDIESVTTRPIDAFKPANGDEQKRLFLAGEIDTPEMAYDTLAAIDFTDVDTKLMTYGEEIASNTDIPVPYRSLFGAYITESRRKNRFLQVNHLLKQDDVDEEEKPQLKSEFEELNEQLFGKLDRHTYVHLLADQFRGLTVPNPSDTRAYQTYRELQELLPPEVLEVKEVDLYRPSDETVETMQRIVNTLYEKLLRHVPEDKESFSGKEFENLVRSIVEDEFGEAAEGWQVQPKKGLTIINVDSMKKIVYVPDEEAKPKTREIVLNMVVHEIGVHALRAIMGSESDFYLMQIGFPEFFDSEEGLGVFMEQARKGVFRQGGPQHYTTAGLLKDGRSFREAHDIRWRIAALQKYKVGEDFTDETVKGEQSTAYTVIRRAVSGTDHLVWHKNLSYYTGSVSMWQFFERHLGDDLMLSLALFGKLDPTNMDHLRAGLETRTP